MKSMKKSLLGAGIILSVLSGCASKQAPEQKLPYRVWTLQTLKQ